MSTFFIASLITTAVVSIWLTAVVSVAIKNQFSQRQLRLIQYWQARAMKAENMTWRQA